jgi:hypothetical protein
MAKQFRGSRMDPVSAASITSAALDTSDFHPKELSYTTSITA